VTISENNGCEVITLLFIFSCMAEYVPRDFSLCLKALSFEPFSLKFIYVKIKYLNGLFKVNLQNINKADTGIISEGPQSHT